ncbi:hypothetical protein, partial [Pandoraea pnomenusa]|uniref:hypothetical protein n=1 Tax=Pandoraea pnomenusa TaxID=93220 RepID=UPI002430E05C
MWLFVVLSPVETEPAWLSKLVESDVRLSASVNAPSASVATPDESELTRPSRSLVSDAMWLFVVLSPVETEP